MTQETNHAIENAIASYETIVEWITRLNDGDEDVREEIDEDPLSIEVRCDWRTPGDGDDKPTEYLILLTTGGPALRIIGDLNEYCEPETAKLQWQDWGTPWNTIWKHETVDIDESVLLDYARCFYYGE